MQLSTYAPPLVSSHIYILADWCSSVSAGEQAGIRNLLKGTDGTLMLQKRIQSRAVTFSRHRLQPFILTQSCRRLFYWLIEMEARSLTPDCCSRPHSRWFSSVDADRALFAFWTPATQMVCLSSIKQVMSFQHMFPHIPPDSLRVFKPCWAQLQLANKAFTFWMFSVGHHKPLREPFNVHTVLCIRHQCIYHMHHQSPW